MSPDEPLRSWTLPDLHRQLARFEDELRAAGYTDAAVARFVDGSRDFVRWLGGRFRPGG
ncbi:MAG: hypothetical protein QM733_20515 [Ilumatobacteraceae bacterium]